MLAIVMATFFAKAPPIRATLPPTQIEVKAQIQRYASKASNSLISGTKEVFPETTGPIRLSKVHKARNLANGMAASAGIQSPGLK
jgi:hypothetical protein